MWPATHSIQLTLDTNIYTLKERTSLKSLQSSSSTSDSLSLFLKKNMLFKKKKRRNISTIIKYNILKIAQTIFDGTDISHRIFLMDPRNGQILEQRVDHLKTECLNLNLSKICIKKIIFPLLAF